MFTRYAIFYTPTGALYDDGAAWLGWDSAKGSTVPHPAVAGVDVAAVTATPRKYGIHGTLKAPFRLAEEATEAQLLAMAEAFAAETKACEIGPLSLRHQSGFVALRPVGQPAPLQSLAAKIVRNFDPLRAPLTDADIARRRRANLSARQDAQMLQWGYPFIFDDFHFHLTLSGRLTEGEAAPVLAALQPMLMGHLTAPATIDAITVMGEDAAGLFHQIHRYTLTG